MSEAMNLDSNDIVGSLSEFEGLETIEAELDILNQESEENIRVVRSEDMEIIPTIIGKSDMTEIKEEMDEEGLQDEEDDDMNESITAEIMGGNEMMHDMMHDGEIEMQDVDREMDEQHEDSGDVRESEGQDDDQEELHDSDDQHRLFSEGVIGDEEIIDDSQIITEDVGDVHHLLSRGHIHDEQILEDSEVKYLDDIMNDDVNETIIEAAEVEDRTGDPEGAYGDDDEEIVDENQGMVVDQVPSLLTTDHITDEIITADRDPIAESITPIDVVCEQKPDISHIDNTPVVINNESEMLQLPKIEKFDKTIPGKFIMEQGLTPLTVVSKSDAQVQEAVKSITSGVYVMNSSGTATPITQTFIQSGGTIIAPKDAKISRVMTIPNIEAGSGQTIRIVAPAGKFNSTAKAITLAQARQMGLISPSGRINNILPSTAKPITTQQLGIKQLVVPSNTKKTVTVVKSPTKILPAPPATGHKPQKVLIRQANSLKTGTIVTSASSGHPPGTHMIRIPANQTLQQILPGGSKQVQYVKLVSGGTKGQTLVPVSLSKTIPMLTTNLLSSPTTTFKVVPISTQAGSATTSGQRVFIPASAVNSTQNQGISQSQIVMLPSQLIQQVKKGDCKLVPAVSSGGIPTLRTTTTVNGNRKVVPAPTVPPLKIKEPAPIAPSTPVRVVSTVTSMSGSVQATTPVSITTATSPPTPPPLLPTPAATPPTPPAPTQTSPQGLASTQTPQGTTGTPTSGSSPTPVNSSMNIGVLPLPKIEVKQEQWSGDESYFEANGIRPRKPCNCTKSMCLKLYCDCFANGEFCFQCNCTCCYNNLDHEEERQRAIKSCLERNPTAFRPKIGKTLAGSEERRHNRGCNCKRSGCLKNYCECFEAKIPCSKNCKCAGCRNTEMYPHGRRDDDRLRYRMDSKTYDTHPGHMYTSACRQAFSMMSPELIQATCQCLIAQAEKWDSPSEEAKEGSEQAQKLIIEEFGHCIVQIIDCVTKSIPQQAPVSSS